MSAFIGFIGLAVARQWSRVGEALGELSVAAIGVASLTMLAGIWCGFRCWQAILSDFGSNVPMVGGMRVFFVGQAGKYLPGKLWPILTQAKLGRQYGVPGRASAAAAAIFMGVVLATGLVVAVCATPALGAAAYERYWWALLALPVAAVALSPPVLNLALGRALRLARRDPMPRPLTVGGIGRAVGWALIMWALYGVHLWALLTDLGATAPDLLLRSTGAFAGSWSIGFLLLVAPAGVGPREVALVVLLNSTAAQPLALVAAMVSRLLMTVGDLVWPVVALLLARWRRRSSELSAGELSPRRSSTGTE